MNLTEAHKIAQSAAGAADAALSGAQLLLSRKMKERDARMERYEQIVTIMEAESKAADDEIEQLKTLIFGAPQPVQETAVGESGETLQQPIDQKAA